MRENSKRWHKYRVYLNSSHWQEKRTAALAAAGHCCARCPRHDELHVHHLTYRRLGNEALADLLVLCKECHMAEHAEQRARKKARLAQAEIQKARANARKAERKRRLRKSKLLSGPIRSQPKSKKKKILIAANEQLHAIQVANRRRREYRW